MCDNREHYDIAMEKFHNWLQSETAKRNSTVMTIDIYTEIVKYIKAKSSVDIKRHITTFFGQFFKYHFLRS